MLLKYLVSTGRSRDFKPAKGACIENVLEEAKTLATERKSTVCVVLPGLTLEVRGNFEITSILPKESNVLQDRLAEIADLKKKRDTYFKDSADKDKEIAGLRKDIEDLKNKATLDLTEKSIKADGLKNKNADLEDKLWGAQKRQKELGSDIERSKAINSDLIEKVVQLELELGEARRESIEFFSMLTLVKEKLWLLERNLRDRFWPFCWANKVANKIQKIVDG
jgi:hypothetical protein